MVEIKKIKKETLEEDDSIFDWADNLKKYGNSLVSKWPIKGRHCFAAYENNIVGFIIFTKSTRRNKSIVTIDLICVNPNQRGKGIGKLLLARVAEKYSNENNIELQASVNHMNLASKKVFLSGGAVKHDDIFIIANPSLVNKKMKAANCKNEHKCYVNRTTKNNKHGFCRRPIGGSLLNLKEIKNKVKNHPNKPRGYSKMNKAKLVKFLKNKGISV